MTANIVTACGRWLVILLFLAAIGLPGLTMLLTPARDWSEREKRKLAELPAPQREGGRPPPRRTRPRRLRRPQHHRPRRPPPPRS